MLMKKSVLEGLKELADIELQKKLWLSALCQHSCRVKLN
jgi:hypothetical protein